MWIIRHALSSYKESLHKKKRSSSYDRDTKIQSEPSILIQEKWAISITLSFFLLWIIKRNENKRKNQIKMSCTAKSVFVLNANDNGNQI